MLWIFIFFSENMRTHKWRRAFNLRNAIVANVVITLLERFLWKKKIEREEKVICYAWMHNNRDTRMWIEGCECSFIISRSWKWESRLNSTKSNYAGSCHTLLTIVWFFYSTDSSFLKSAEIINELFSWSWRKTETNMAQVIFYT